MIELTRASGNSESEMVTLFSIDGEEYRVPARPRVNVALKYLTNAREYGEQLAQMMLLEELLGADGYKALSEYDDLTPEQLTEVANLAAELTLGGLESGNDKSGSKKSRG